MSDERDYKEEKSLDARRVPNKRKKKKRTDKSLQYAVVSSYPKHPQWGEFVATRSSDLQECIRYRDRENRAYSSFKKTVVIDTWSENKIVD